MQSAIGLTLVPDEDLENFIRFIYQGHIPFPLERRRLMELGFNSLADHASGIVGQMAEALKQAGVDHGLLIEDVGGPAAAAGVEAGDVLLAMNGKPVQNVEQVRQALKGKPRHVALLISRDGQQIFVPVELG